MLLSPLLKLQLLFAFSVEASAKMMLKRILATFVDFSV
uniref:Uncharacterized protein n=1 Tax=Rhizophora mucronata TaxID=61149 RepID=A0A2P2Q491_RHIMU